MKVIKAFTLAAATLGMTHLAYGYYNLGAFWKGSSCSTIAYVQSANGTGSQTASATLTVTAGHLLVAGIFFGTQAGASQETDSAVVSDTLGNTWQSVTVQNGQYGAAQIWYVANSLGGSDTVTMTQTVTSNESGGIFVVEYSGVATSNAVDVSSGQTAAGGYTITTGNMTTTETCNDLVVGMFLNNSSALTVSSGETSRQSVSYNGNDALIEDDLPTGAAKNSVVDSSVTTTGSASWAATQVAFRAQGSTIPSSPTKIAFTTSAQTLTTETCSGAVTIQSQSSSGTAVNAQSAIPINLSGTQVQFYSDSACSYPITATTIGSGSSSETIYLSYYGNSSGLITASPTNGFSSITQTETLSAANYTWIGGASCDGTWSTGACWQGGVAPNSTEVAYFDAVCSTNCSATLGASTSIGGLYLRTGYSSSVNVGTYTLTLGDAIPTEPDYPSGNGWTNQSYGLVLEAGTLNAGSGAVTVNGAGNGSAVLGANGTFNGNSATITIANQFTNAGGTWNPGTSTMIANGPMLLDSFYNLTAGVYAFFSATAAPIVVNGNVVIESTCSYCGSNCTDMTVAGNWTSNGTWNITGCDESVTFGAGANHTIGGTANATFGQLILDNSSSATNNTVTFTAGNSVTVSAGTTFKGNSATYPLKLRSSSTGTAWKINSSGTNTASYVDVEDSDNTNGTAIVAKPGVDSGNNTNWTFYDVVTQVQNPEVYDSTSCTACTITVNSTGTGNLIVVAASWAGSATVSSVTDNAASGGNTYSSAETAATTTAPAGGTAIYYALNSKSGATTITLNLSASSKPSIFVYEYSGIATSGALDQVSAKTNATASKTVTGASVTTTQALEVIFSVAYGPGTITSTKSGNVFTGDTTIENGDDASTYAPTATGTYNAAWTQTSTDSYAVSTASFKVGTN